MSEWWSVVSSVVRNEPDRVALQGLIFLVVALLVRRSRKAARAWTAADPSVAFGMSVFEKPVALAALVALSLTPWIYVSTPPAIDDLVALVLVAPVVRLVSPLLDKSVRPALYMLAGLYVIYRLQDLIEGAPIVARLIFVVEMIVAIAIVIWSIRSIVLYGQSQEK